MTPQPQESYLGSTAKVQAAVSRKLTRIIVVVFATVIASCGGGGSSGGNDDRPPPPPPPPATLAGIDLSQASLTLDRWGDTASITAQPIDQNGNNIGGATITWSSSDDTIASVDNTGRITTWLDGTVDIRVEAMLNSVTVAETVTVNVAIQQNNNCQVPAEFPVRGPVTPPNHWDVRKVETQAFPADAPIVEVLRQITLDVDRDGDPDLLSAVSTPNLQGISVPIETEHRIWLNDGTGSFADGTGAILGQNIIPWNGPRNMGYADFDADGFQDVVVFQQGWERDPSGCGVVQGSCAGGPNLLFLPQVNEFSDSAPTRLSPYDDNGFTHSGSVGDVDCDGDVDILETNWPNADAPAAHHLQINSGTGTFLAEDLRLPLELLEISVSASVLCDVDRDGDPDIVAGIPGASDTGVTRVLVNDGFGHFRFVEQDVFPVMGLASEAACGDLDLDGFNDIVLNATPSTVYRNNGDMSFSRVTTGELPPDLTSNGLGVIDLNGDGWLDITPESGEAVYWNVGDGTFTSTAMPGVCCNTFTTVADFDTDGQQDVFMFNSHDAAEPNTLFLNRPGPVPVMRVFATSNLYTANLGGLTGADAICQVHAEAASLPGTYVAYLSDSTTHAINRIPEAEYRRVGDNAVVIPSKVKLLTTELENAVGNDEFGSTILANTEVMTGTDGRGVRVRRADQGVGFCSDWTRDTDELPGLVASGDVDSREPPWVWGADRNCSESQRLYCFQSSEN